MIDVYADGSYDNRKKSGRGVIGIAAYDGAKEIYQQAIRVRVKSSNEAEYRALIFALRWLEKYHHSATIKLDSELVVRQVNGEYKVRAVNLLPLWSAANSLMQKTGAKLVWVSRDENTRADALSKGVE